MVTYNSAEVVAASLNALPADVEVIVVDNASADHTRSVVLDNRPDTEWVQTGANLGFAPAVNIAAKRARGELFLLLNPDAMIAERAINDVLAVFDKHPDVAVAAPIVVEAGGHLTTMAGGFEPTIWRMFTHSSGLSRLAKKIPLLRGHYLLQGQQKREGLTDLDWVSGGCLFVRRSAWTELGGLTERWFMYAEDVEFCLRIRDQGHRVVLAPWAEAEHAVGGSSSGTSAVRTQWLENLFDLYQMRYRAGFIRSWIWRFVVAGGYAARALVLRVTFSARGDRAAHQRFASYARAIVSSKRRGE
ncbi:glycosyltransferase family 2 protein [Microbacterium arborescens]|uniref:glycosyltransferase family 2 protein n=1 Tax=Microbacterium arborescens TaxID=33883 RepID=UPI0025A0FB9D|nr:glycosyltransferase family 2 protein [Microbacterium arborescens]WJM17337.1 glycosyltransferase family 2 protein [Microbacterium arborescens]